MKFLKLTMDHSTNHLYINALAIIAVQSQPAVRWVGTAPDAVQESYIKTYVYLGAGEEDNCFAVLETAEEIMKELEQL